MPSKPENAKVENVISCIDIDENRNRIEKFFAYYRSLGVTNFMIIVNSESNDTQRTDEFTRFLSSLDVEPLEVWCEKFDDYTVRDKMNACRNAWLQPDEWCFQADVDEFVEVDAAFLRDLQNSEANYVEGKLIDRLDRHGTFPEISKDTDLEQTFPLKGLLSEQLLGAYIGKIPLARAALQVDVGHHWLCREGQTVAPQPFYVNGQKAQIAVNHFKWSADVLVKIQQRLKTKVKDSEILWRREMALFLAEIILNQKEVVLNLSQFDIWE